MIVAQVLTSWINSVTPINSNCPQLLANYQLNYSDVTNQPGEFIIPDPNLLVVQIICTPETLALIEADPLYKVLWSEAQ